MDIHTLHVEHTVLLAVYTLLTIANARIHKGIAGIHWFSLYNALLFIGAMLVAFRGHMPDFLSIVVGNMFVISGYGGKHAKLPSVKLKYIENTVQGSSLKLAMGAPKLVGTTSTRTWVFLSKLT